MQSYMLIEQAQAPRITRQLRQQFGRMAFVTDAGTVELTVNSLGAWSVQVGPAPTKGGEFVKVANGSVKEPTVNPGNPHPRFEYDWLPGQSAEYRRSHGIEG